jgi:hypothetical protein
VRDVSSYQNSHFVTTDALSRSALLLVHLFSSYTFRGNGLQREDKWSSWIDVHLHISSMVLASIPGPSLSDSTLKTGRYTKLHGFLCKLSSVVHIRPGKHLVHESFEPLVGGLVAHHCSINARARNFSLMAPTLTSWPPASVTTMHQRSMDRFVENSILCRSKRAYPVTHGASDILPLMFHKMPSPGFPAIMCISDISNIEGEGYPPLHCTRLLSIFILFGYPSVPSF